MMGMSEEFGEMLRSLMRRDNTEYEAIAQLSADQKKEWDECIQMLEEGEMIISEAKARKDLLWARIRRSLLPNDNREYLKIEDGILWGSKDQPKEMLKEQPPQLED